MTHHFLTRDPENTERCTRCGNPCRSHSPRYYSVVLPEDDGAIHQHFRHEECHRETFPDFHLSES